MDNKGGLGKGISVLFGNKNIDPDNVTGEGTGSQSKEQLFIETDKIRRNPYQPREDFNEEELNELSESIINYVTVYNKLHHNL